MESPWQQLHGKISKKRTRIVWAENAYGTRFTQVRGKRGSKETAAELATRQKFCQASAQTVAIMHDVDQLEAYKSAWRNGGYVKYKTLRGFIFAQVYRSL